MEEATKTIDLDGLGRAAQQHSLLSFDSLEPAEEPVTLAGKQYILSEALEDGASRYENFNASRTKFSPEGKFLGVGDVADGRALLVSLCLSEVVKAADGTEKRVPVPWPVVKGWRSSVVKALFERAKKLSDIGQETEAFLEARIKADQAKLAELRAARGAEASPEKNGHADTTPTSASATS